MYTQSFSVPDDAEAKAGLKAVPKPASENDAALMAQFEARIAADGPLVVEVVHHAAARAKHKAHVLLAVVEHILLIQD